MVDGIEKKSEEKTHIRDNKDSLSLKLVQGYYKEKGEDAKKGEDLAKFEEYYIGPKALEASVTADAEMAAMSMAALKVIKHSYDGDAEKFAADFKANKPIKLTDKNRERPIKEQLTLLGLKFLPDQLSAARELGDNYPLYRMNLSNILDKAEEIKLPQDVKMGIKEYVNEAKPAGKEKGREGASLTPIESAGIEVALADKSNFKSEFAVHSGPAKVRDTGMSFTTVA